MRPLVGYIRTGIGPKWAEYGPLGPHGAQNGRKDRSSQYVYGTCFFVLLPELQKTGSAYLSERGGITRATRKIRRELKKC